MLYTNFNRKFTFKKSLVSCQKNKNKNHLSFCMENLAVHNFFFYNISFLRNLKCYFIIIIINEQLRLGRYDIRKKKKKKIHGCEFMISLKFIKWISIYIFVLRSYNSSKHYTFLILSFILKCLNK